MKQVGTLNYLRNSNLLEIVWLDGRSLQIEGQKLRLACKCGDCSSDRQRDLPPADAERAFRVKAIEAVGSYGIRLFFEDGHNRGIYPWRYLEQIGDMDIERRLPI
ncbi:DUF971 domain-containing protein [Collimonas antrihumi]|uniref:DUF971 domain-containing protein n=1 Tax=Collimonas antrihumi TaxID=1940615 RepID=UPI001B8C2536|nr:DUF971 domain-containing protein [Collimonas antrihumi]